MKKIFFFYLVSVLVFGCSRNKIDIYTNVWRYSIESTFTSKSGSKAFKIWSYSPNVEYGLELAKRNAVHGVIFKGIPGSPDKRVEGQMALLRSSSAESQNLAYFNNFFANGGPYLKFVSQGSDDAPEIVRVSKKELKIGIVVVVNSELLRKQLEEDGIIRKLGL
jgi:hypothetical protein